MDLTEAKHIARIRTTQNLIDTLESELREYWAMIQKASAVSDSIDRFLGIERGRVRAQQGD